MDSFISSFIHYPRYEFGKQNGEWTRVRFPLSPTARDVAFMMHTQL
jgi:hypothetical protein